jgi:hypothetical protein
MLEIILLLGIALPVAWFASEFWPHRWLRLLLGSSAIGVSFLIAYGVGSLEQFNANAWYGGASQNLIDATVTELESGNTDQVLRELKALQKDFQPTYENRAKYDKLIEEYLKRLGHEWKHRV